MGDYTPTTEEVRLEYMAVRWGKSDIVSFDARAEFDRWLAEVRREAAEKAWNRCVGEMPIDLDWKNFYSDNNPYSAEAYRQEKGRTMRDLGCHADGNVIACRKEAGTGCPGADGGPHYFIWMDGDERQCMDCGIGQAEALGAVRDDG